MTGASLSGSEVRDVVFVGCRIDLASFRDAELDRVRFEDCRLDEADFRQARLASVVFDGCSLRRSSWSGARLTRSEMRRCDLSGAENVEHLRGVRMTWPDVLNAVAELAAAVGIEVVD
jgi:uncharacterized protein YjbI with pentapeptide repeats